GFEVTGEIVVCNEAAVKFDSKFECFDVFWPESEGESPQKACIVESFELVLYDMCGSCNDLARGDEQDGGDVVGFEFDELFEREAGWFSDEQAEFAAEAVDVTGPVVGCGLALFDAFECQGISGCGFEYVFVVRVCAEWIVETIEQEIGQLAFA